MKVLLFCCKGFETMEFAPFVDETYYLIKSYMGKIRIGNGR